MDKDHHPIPRGYSENAVSWEAAWSIVYGQWGTRPLKKRICEAKEKMSAGEKEDERPGRSRARRRVSLEMPLKTESLTSEESRGCNIGSGETEKSGLESIFRELRITVRNRWLMKYPEGLDAGSAALRDLAELMHPIDSLKSEIKAMLQQYPDPE